MSMVPAKQATPLIREEDKLPQPDPNKKPEETKSPALMPGGKAFESAEAALLHFVARCPGTVTVQDLLRPDFWRHVAPRLKVNAVITCLSDNSAFDVDVRVIEHFGKTVSVRLIRVAPVDKRERGASKLGEDDFAIHFMPNRGHGVRSKGDGTWLVQDLADAEAAKRWIAEHLANNRKA